MILRRLTEHVKHENWFAVALDFVIVVAGVFVGIQVSNWNEARAFRTQELSYLAQLRDEIVRSGTAVEYQIAYGNTVVESGRRALAFLERGQPCGHDCAGLLVDFFHASQVWATPRADPIFREMERLGLPSNREAREAVQAHYRFLDGWNLITLTPPAYRETVRGHFTPDASKAMWLHCHRTVRGELEELVRDCEDELEKLDPAGMLEDIRMAHGLPEQLRFWIGQNNLALRELPVALLHAERATAAIDKELDGHQ